MAISVSVFDKVIRLIQDAGVVCDVIVLLMIAVVSSVSYKVLLGLAVNLIVQPVRLYAVQSELVIVIGIL